jgi:AraC-like DNA-binding protein
MDYITIFIVTHMEEKLKKKEGFRGQKAIVIPRPVLNNRCARNIIICSLYITDIGFYPKAEHHYRERPMGADQHIMIYCSEGRGWIKFRGNEYKMEPGDYCFIPQREPHAYAADTNNPWTIYWFHFKGSNADAVVGELSKTGRLKGFIRYNAMCISLFDEIYARLDSGFGNESMQYANMSFWKLLAAFIYNAESVADDKLREKDAVESATEYMKSNISKSLTLNQVSREVNLSGSHFSYLFRKKTGFPPMEYFNHMKVQLACQFLMFTEMRIKEIALEVGIVDQYYFSRLFSRVMGLSPNQYREKRVM